MNLSDLVDGAVARIGSRVRLTPVEESFVLGSLTGMEVWLKLEHLQHTGSFKARGAMNRMLTLTREELARGVVTASNGNHGMAVCHAAAAAGVVPLVCLRNGVSPARVELIRRLGGEVIFHGETPLEAEVAARRLAAETGRVFISPYNDPEVIAGQGTIGVELDSQIGHLDAVFVSVGGGGLIAGVAAALRRRQPSVKIIGCWPENSPVLYECMRAGRVIEVPERPTISVSTAGGIEEGSVTLDLCRQLIDDAVLVSEDEIGQAMELVARHERWIVEGAAGVAVAGLLRYHGLTPGARVAVLLCGRNRW